MVSSDLVFLEKLANNDPSVIPPPLVGSSTVFENETRFETFSFTLPRTGIYILGIGVTGITDDSYDSGIIIDDFKVVSVPEPSTVILLGAGFVGVVLDRPS